MRRITKAKITFLSLCPKGKNKLPTIFKEDGGIEVGMLTKDMSEEGVILALVYAPEVRDADGDIASAAVIKDMAYSAARDGMALDLRHDGVALKKEQAFVAEQFIVQKGDPRFEGMLSYDGQAVDPTGSWGVVIKVDDPQLRARYRSGEWGGVSMFGTAEVVHTSKSDDDGLADRIVARLTKKITQEEDTMTNEQIQTLAKAITDGVVAGIAKSAEAAPAAAAPAEAAPAAAAPVFKGDPTCVEDVKAYREALHKHDLQQRLAKAKTSAEVDAILADVSKSDEAGTSGASGESDELKKARADLAKSQEQIRKLEGASRQPGTDETTPIVEGFAKEDIEADKLGAAMAAWSNKQRAG
jgi:hypothetical protein